MKKLLLIPALLLSFASSYGMEDHSTDTAHGTKRKLETILPKSVRFDQSKKFQKSDTIFEISGLGDVLGGRNDLKAEHFIEYLETCPAEKHYSITFKNNNPHGPYRNDLDINSKMNIICELLKHDRVEKLNIGSFTPSPKHISDLAKALTNAQRLVSLNFDGLALDDEKAIEIFSALKCLGSKANLSQLFLSVNKITDKGAGVLADLLQNSPHLSEVDLGENPLGDKGIQWIVKALQAQETSLRSLYIFSVGMTDEGMKSFAEILSADNTLLERLDIAANDCSNGMPIAKALKTNKSLAYLDCASMDIDEEVAKELGEALTTNITLKEVIFDGFSSRRAIKTFMNAIPKNKRPFTLKLKIREWDEYIDGKLSKFQKRGIIIE